MALVSNGLPPTSSAWNDSAWRSRSSFDEAADGAVDRAVGAQPRQLRRDAHHVGEAQEGGVDQLLVAGLEHAPAVVDEALEAGGVAGRQRRDLRAHRSGVPP